MAPHRLRRVTERSAFVVFTLCAAAALGSACGDDSNGSGPVAPGNADGSAGSTNDGGALGDGAGKDKDARPGDKSCSPMLQSGSPVQIDPEPRFYTDVPRFVALDPPGELVMASDTVTHVYVSRDKKGIDLHCSSGSLKVPQIFADADGNLFVPGVFAFNMDLGGAEDGGDVHLEASDGKTFLAKYDPDSKLLFVKQYSGNPTLTGAALAPNGHIWITGSFQSTEAPDFGLGPLGADAGAGAAFLVELDATGHALFQRTFGNADTKTGKLAIGADGGPVVSAYLGTHLAGVTNWGLALAAFTSTGADRWFKAFQMQPMGSAPPETVVTSPTGTIAIGGHYYGGTLDLGGGTLPPAPESAPTLAFVAEFASDGTYVGHRAFSDAFVSHASSLPLAFRSDGALYVGGGLQAAFDFGSGTIAPVNGELSPLLLTFDTTMKVTAATAFAPSCAEKGGGAVYGIGVPSTGPLRIAATTSRMGNVSPYAAPFLTHITP